MSVAWYIAAVVTLVVAVAIGTVAVERIHRFWLGGAVLTLAILVGGTVAAVCVAAACAAS